MEAILKQTAIGEDPGAATRAAITGSTRRDLTGSAMAVVDGADVGIALGLSSDDDAGAGAGAGAGEGDAVWQMWHEIFPELFACLANL